MADNLELTVKVNTDTGQLEVLGSKLQKAGDSAKSAKSSFGGLSGEAKGLATSMLGIGSAVGVISFFANAVKGAEEENEALRRLKFTLESTGQSWDDSKGAIDEWSKAVQTSTRFSDGQALQSLDKLARSTKNVGQAQSAATLAMNLSVSSGKSLADTTDFVNGLINKQERAVTQAHKEFGKWTENAHSAQQVLDILAQKTADAAIKEDSYTKSLALTKNAFSEFSDQIGQAIMPGIATLTQGLTYVLKVVQALGTGVASMAAIWFHTISGVVDAVKAVVSGNFSEIGGIVRRTMIEVTSDTVEAGKTIVDEWTKQEEKKTEVVKQAGKQRVEASGRINEEELRKREEMLAKAAQMSEELEQKIQGIGIQTFAKKAASLEAEVRSRRSKIQQEIKDETEKQKLLDKLNDYEKTAYADLQKTETFTKAQAAFEIANIAVQTLQTLNALGNSGSASERMRAKALLALQQSIAIGWAWVNAMKVGGPFATPLAIATTALLVTQFAQQSKNIDRAAASEKSGLAAVPTIALPNAPGIDPSPIGGGTPGVVSSGGSFSGSGGGGGGGGGGTVINVGGLTVNLDVDKLSTDNVREVMLRITEAVRQGAVEGVQMAVTLQNSADKNSTRAV